MSINSRLQNEPMPAAEGSPETRVKALSLMRGQTRPVRIMLATLLFVLGLVSAVVCGAPWSGMLVAGLVLFAFVRTGHTAWLFVFCFAVIAVQASGGFLGQYRQTFSGAELLQVVLIFLIMVAGFRFAELTKYSAAFNIDRVYDSAAGEPGQRLGFQWQWVGQIVRRHWALSMIALLGSFLLLSYLPLDDSYLYKYWLQPRPGRLIILSLLLFFAWFICRAVIGILEWLELTPQKADVAFRSWYNREMWSEMAGVESRRRKLRTSDDDVTRASAE